MYKLIKSQTKKTARFPSQMNFISGGQIASAMRLLIKRKDLREFLSTGKLSFSYEKDVKGGTEQEFSLVLEKVIIMPNEDDVNQPVMVKMVSTLYANPAFWTKDNTPPDQNYKVRKVTQIVFNKPPILAALYTINKAYAEAQELQAQVFNDLG